MTVIDVSWFYGSLITFCMHYPEITAEFFVFFSAVKSINDSLEQFADAFFMISVVCERKASNINRIFG